MDNPWRLLRGLCPPSRWAAWANPMKSPRLRFFWRRMTRVSSRVSNCSLMAAEGKSEVEAAKCQCPLTLHGCTNETPHNQLDSRFRVPGLCARLHGGEQAANCDCNAGRTWTRESRVHPRAIR